MSQTEFPRFCMWIAAHLAAERIDGERETLPLLLHQRIRDPAVISRVIITGRRYRHQIA